MENFIIPFVKQGGDWSDQLDKFINNSLENKWVFLLPNHYCEPVSQLKCRL